MNLQDTFYLFGIIFMVLSILLTLTITIVLLVIAKRVKDAYDKVENRLSVVKEVVAHPREAAQRVGAAAADLVFTHALNPRKSKRRRK